MICNVTSRYVSGVGRSSESIADIPETFNYLPGLHVRLRRAYDNNGRRYLMYNGETLDNRAVTRPWRETGGRKKEDFERDEKFVTDMNMTEGADGVFVNGASFIPNARSLEQVFKARMFAVVEA
jgi:adenine-specific DNA-methyltransferase